MLRKPNRSSKANDTLSLMDLRSLSPYGEWDDKSIKVEGKSSRVTAKTGEYLVVGRFQNTKLQSSFLIELNNSVLVVCSFSDVHVEREFIDGKYS